MHDIYRDGRIHVLTEQCSTCIFNPHTRPVPGARVAEMVLGTKDTDLATVPCHHTLYGMAEHNAICRGWWDRFATRDNLLRYAMRIGIVVYDDLPPEDDDNFSPAKGPDKIDEVDEHE